MATRTTTGSYVVAGDPKERRLPNVEAAICLAITLVSREPADGEEYRRGVLLNGDVVASVVRETDTSITIRKGATS